MNKNKKCLPFIYSTIVCLLLPLFCLCGEEFASGNIIGRVIDGNTHLPIAHASVEVTRGHTTIVSVYTDENGVYSISELGSRPYLIRVHTPNFQSSVQLGIPIPGQTITIDFILHPPSGEVKGQVINAITMEPISNARVDILNEDIVIQSVTANEHGDYLISDLIPKDYMIRASTANFQVASQSITVLTDQTILVNVVLQPSGNVVGQVIHTFTGQPIAGVCIGMWQNDQLITHTLTDANGYYALSGLGYSHLVAQVVHFKDLTQSVQILPLQTTTLNFSLVCIEPTPPQNVRGKMISRRRSINHVNRKNRIKWDPSSDSTVTSYRIYHDHKCIGEVSADDALIYFDEWKKDKKRTYFLTAVNAFEQESVPVSVKIKK